MNKRLVLLLLVFCTFTVNAQYGPALNKDGSVVTGVLTASFDPFGSFSYNQQPVLPFPSSLALITTTDMTLDIPVEDPDNTGDPAVALSALDGFSTTEKWVAGFAWGNPGDYDNAVPGSVDPTSVVPGQSVRVFEVTTSGFVAVTSIVSELVPGVDYVALAVTQNQIAIIPLRPLKEYTSYMAVLTNDINDMDGNDATPDRTYGFGKTQTPWIDEDGQSTYSLFSNEAAAELEVIRQVVQSMELNAASVGINPDDIVLAWTVQTQSITRTLKTLRAMAQPAPTKIASANMDTSAFGLLGLADVNIGIITMPYYAGVPSAENPTALLTENWHAAPGAYVPPFDKFGLDPTSTHITIANPIPVVTSMQTVPLFVTVPNAKSGHTKPAAGWPVVIFGHGLQGNRVQALAIADTMASIGYAVVAMDFPGHGISPDAQPELAPLWVENTPFAPFANERTFDVDYINNETFAPGRDGLIDPSGVLAIPVMLSSMLTGRDLIRQGIADLSQLAVSIQNMDFDGDGSADTNGSNIAFVGISWGSVHGTAFTALEPLVTRTFLSVPGGGLARMLNASDFVGPIMKSLLKAGAGLEPGTADYEKFLLALQTVLDSADPINWSAAAATNTPIMLHEVINDEVIPNFVLTGPLSGTEPMIAVMGLDAYSTSQQSADGLRSAGRFVPPARHSQLGRPTSGSPPAFFEMQKQMATFIASHGGQIVVTNESTMVPIIPIEIQPVMDLSEDGGSNKGDDGKRTDTRNGFRPVERLDSVNRLNRLNGFK